MVELLKNLKHIKMGICSQNSNENIRETLKYYGVDNCFDAVIGYDDILGSEQKPDPAGFIKCIEQLKLNNKKGTFIYIGDHSEDIVFGKNAQDELNQEDTNVICITVDFLNLNSNSYDKWTNKPDYFVQTTDELNSVLNKLLVKVGRINEGNNY